jgi:hypothetical protein
MTRTTFARDCWDAIGLLISHSDPWLAFDDLKNQLRVPFFNGDYCSDELEHLDAAQRFDLHKYSTFPHKLPELFQARICSGYS